ncbi:uroporphyrinogen-III synthase [Oerskovia enterophila]|uniref:uroporphyrinogen-III synthase n=1 Tax=Oerskovia enterophila TaxID=43678 RepID=UPI0038010EA0
MPGRLRDPQRGRDLPPVPARPATPAADTSSETPARPAAVSDAVGPDDAAPPTDTDAPAASGAVGQGDVPVAHDPATSGPARAVGALTGNTVLVPRSPERAEPLAARLRAQGATVLVSPAIERAPIEDTAAMDAAVADLAHGAFAWVVVTSVNAIDELTASAARRGLDLAALAGPAGTGGAADSAGPGTRWAAVGPATRRALEAVGVHVDLEATVNSARGLLAAFDALTDQLSEAHRAEPRATSDDSSASTSSRRVLVPQGDLAKPTMAEGLRERGWDVHVVTAYRTVSHALSPEVVEAWRAGAVDVVVLTSGSVAREVAAQLGVDPRVAGVAIGEPTAEAAHAVGLRIDAVAEKATDEALAGAVLRVGAELSEAHRGIPRVSSDNESLGAGPGPAGAAGPVGPVGPGRSRTVPSPAPAHTGTPTSPDPAPTGTTSPAPLDQLSELTRAIPRPSSDNPSPTEGRNLP